ncbi:MAG: heat-inducible transcriptional repressor HrcA [Actinomycetota bacterium]
MSSIPERPLEVLRAIVQDYIQSREPVGSKSLVERHSFGVSAATIRNDMAILEEEELIIAPHTSSGRVPTDKGYRVFVDRLGEVKPLSSAERAAIEGFLSGSSDLDEILAHTVRSLAQLTNQVALVQYPSLGKSSVRHIELIPVDNKKLMLMLITDSGRIQQHVMELSAISLSTQIEKLRNALNKNFAGKPLSEITKLSKQLMESIPADLKKLAKEVLPDLLLLVDANSQEKILLAGTSNLARREEDFPGSISPLLEAIEEQVVLLRLMSEMQADQHGVSLRIGRENQFDALSSASVLVSGYESAGSEVAKIGVIGPTRMDYSSNIGAVRAVARYLSKSLGGSK